MSTATPARSSALPGSTTWEASYCARHGCTARQFRRRLFWESLHRHALPLAPVLLLGPHFTADLELIDGCARAASMRQVREEIEDHHYHPLNRGWLREALALRISTHRL